MWLRCDEKEVGGAGSFLSRFMSVPCSISVLGKLRRSAPRSPRATFSIGVQYVMSSNSRTLQRQQRLIWTDAVRESVPM